MLPKDDAGWSNPRVLFIFAVIFFCGVTFGSLITRSYLHSKMVSARPDELTVESARRVGLRHLKAELNLTPAQERTIMQELDDYGKYYQNIEDQRRDVAEHGRRNILDVLNDDQKKKFNEIFSSAPR